MQKSPYIILKINENASKEQIDQAYIKLKRRYSEDRFLPGEDGRIASEKLSELEEAYEEAQRLYIERQSYQNYGSIFGEIERLVKAGEMEHAQAMLDNMSERSGEWHYLQSIIFYRKNWFTESLKQLEFAMSLEPDNKKYADAHMRLKNLMYGPKPVQGTIDPNQQQNQQYQQNQQDQQNQQYRQNQQYQQNYYQQDNQNRQMGCCSGDGTDESCCMQALCLSCCCNMMSSGC